MTCFVDRLEYFLKTTGSKLSLNATFFFQNKMWLTYILTSTFFYFLHFAIGILQLCYAPKPSTIYIEIFSIIYQSFLWHAKVSVFGKEHRGQISKLFLAKKTGLWLAGWADWPIRGLVFGGKVLKYLSSMPFSENSDFSIK